MSQDGEAQVLAPAAQDPHPPSRTLYDEMAQGVLYQDADGRLIAANRSAERILGLSFSELRDRLSSDRRWRTVREDGTDYPPDHHPASTALRTGQAVRGVIMGLEHPATGERRWIRMDAVPEFRPGEPRPFRAFAVFDDITDRKRAEEALRQASAKYSELFELGMEAVFLIDNETGRLLEANVAATQMYGFSREELLTMRNTDLSAEPDETTRVTRGSGPGGVVVPLRFHQRRDGTVFPVEITGRFFTWMDRPVHVAAIRDVSDRVRQAQALMDRESELLEAQRVARLGSYVLDVATGDWTSSAMLDEILGIDATFPRTAESLRGLIVPEDRSAVMAHYHRHVLEGREAFDCEARIRRPLDGVVRSVHGRGLLRTDAAGRPTSMVGTVQDITERKDAETVSLRLQDQLQQAMKMEAVGRLAGGVAHDFNNLLTAIGGNVSLALLDLKPGDPLHETLMEVSRAADSAASLTQQLLAFSRKQLIEPRVVDLNQMLERLHRMLVRLIGEDVRLQTVCAEGLHAVRVDPGQVEQILANLAVNARDAMPAGGTLVIETANVVLDEEYARRHADQPPGPYVMLAVSDTGSGMDEPVKQRLFEPFFTTKPSGRGTGLGLATIYGAVKQAGGTIEVYSEVGQGTTFKIFLPSVDGTPEPVEAPTEESAPGAGEQVLLVEDDRAVRTLAAKVLGRLGYEVIEAANGAEALALAAARAGRIHVLVTDVVMPGMNGRQVADRLRPDNPGMAVLYTSGYTEDVIAHHGVVDAGLDFLGKPYSPRSLGDKVREILRRRDVGRGQRTGDGGQ